MRASRRLPQAPWATAYAAQWVRSATVSQATAMLATSAKTTWVFAVCSRAAETRAAARVVPVARAAQAVRAVQAAQAARAAAPARMFRNSRQAWAAKKTAARQIQSRQPVQTAMCPTRDLTNVPITAANSMTGRLWIMRIKATSIRDLTNAPITAVNSMTGQ